jgi:dienelactone hydrolase
MKLSTLRSPVACAASLVLALALCPARTNAQSNAGGGDVERFDGSFRLETGEVVTGGYMVEGGAFWVYMDTEGLERGGLFDRSGDTLISRIPPDGAVRIEFHRGASGGFDELTWREGGRPLHGERVYPHDSRPVSFKSADGTQLRGRLLTPRCPGPHPAVVMVHGSGPANRYGGPFHLFLLKHGVAVLAYDKRGYTPDPDAWREPDLAEMSADAAAGIEFLAGLPEIDDRRVGVWGSSQGGWTAPPAALSAPHAAYLILRAGAALTEAETNLHEIRQELRAEGLHGLELDYAITLRREVYRLAMDGKPITAADALVAPYVEESWYRSAFGDGPISEIWSKRWWGWAQRNLAVESASSVARFDRPVLWFLGERDEAVPLVATRAALERAFERAPGDDHVLVVVSDAPHSFLIRSKDGRLHYAHGVFERVGTWLAERGFTDQSCWAGPGS